MKSRRVLTQSIVAAVLGATGPAAMAASDVTPYSGVLWARASRAGRVCFEVSRSPDFADRRMLSRIVSDSTQPTKAELYGQRPGTTYYYRAVDSSGNSSTGHFATAPATCTDGGVHFGVTGGWRPELAP